MMKKLDRQTKYAVVPVEKLRAINPLDDREVVEAQKGVTDDMIKAFEEMVNAAKAGRLQGDGVLAIGALAWAVVDV